MYEVFLVLANRIKELREDRDRTQKEIASLKEELAEAERKAEKRAAQEKRMKISSPLLAVTFAASMAAPRIMITGRDGIQ